MVFGGRSWSESPRDARSDDQTVAPRQAKGNARRTACVGRSHVHCVPAADGFISDSRWDIWSRSVYWVVWCLALPIAVLGPRRVVALFQPGDSRFAQLGIKIQSILWWPIVFPLSFAFLPRIAAASISVVLASVAVGVIGVTEKLLWRGVYVTLFADNIWLNTIYPSVAFGLWHLARCRLYQAGTPVALCRSPRT